MKKLLMLVICALLLLSFVACDSKTRDDDDDDKGTSTTVSSVQNAGKAETVTVHFALNGGSASSGETTVEIEKGAALSVLLTPDVWKDGFNFLGWSYDEEGFSQWDSSDVILGDTVLYAIWSAETDSPSKPSTGSSKPSTGSSNAVTDSSNTTGSSDTTESSNTTESSQPDAPRKVTVIFRPNGGELEFTTIQIEYGTKLSYTDVPEATKGGYYLKGWAFDPEGNELWSARNHLFTENETVLYAIWESDGSGTTDSSDTTDSSNTTDTSEPTTDSSEPTTDTSKPTTESSKPTTDSSSTTSSTTRPTGPVIVPDRTQYKADVVGDKEAIYYINDLIRHPVLTPYYNGYKAALTMTFDDGYHAETGNNISDQFEKFGFRGTMMLGVCFINSESMIRSWNEVFARGYLDLGCHAYDHKAPSSLSSSEFAHEIRDAVMFLREKFPGQRVLTFATPLAQITDAYEDYLEGLVIGNRLEAGGSTVNLGKDLGYNPYRVKAVSFNVRTNMSGLRTEVESAVKNGSWIVELCHCVKENADGVDVELSVFQNHCEWLYRNYRDSLWVTTFEDVLVYGEQLRHTTIDYTACDREGMTFTVTPDGTLDYTLYKIPMTIMVYLPDFADSAYATVNGEYQPLEITSSPTTGERIVYVRNIDATKVSEVKVYLGANKTMKNNCVHSYSVSEVVEPTHETGGYTLNECSKCAHTYYSKYTNPVHDYTGEEVTVIEPILTQRGLKKVYCTHCDKYIVEEVRYAEE